MERRDLMFIALNLKGTETTHPIEPSYNRLHDRWDSNCKIQVPRGTLRLIGIDSKDVACYEVNSYVNDKAIIEHTNRINF